MTDNGHPQRIGYARVSTVGQNLDSQVDALQQAGCGRIFTDRLGGTTKERPGWDDLCAYPGQTHEISAINAQGVVGAGKVRSRAGLMHSRLVN